MNSCNGCLCPFPEFQSTFSIGFLWFHDEKRKMTGAEGEDDEEVNAMEILWLQV